MLVRSTLIVLLSALAARVSSGQCSGLEFLELERLVPPEGDDPLSRSLFGYSFAANADWLFVGEPGFCVVPGVVQIYRRDPHVLTRWNLKGALTDAEPYDPFGYGATLAFSGDTLAVGHVDFFNNDGAVYLYRRDLGGPGHWGRLKLIYSPLQDQFARFGRWLALSGEYLIASATDFSFGGALGTWIYSRDLGGPDNWGLLKQVWPVGAPVALDGDTLLLGVPRDASSGIDAGAAYVLRRDAGGPDNWGVVRQILASDAAPGDLFGNSVSLSGNTAVIGAPGRDDSGTDSGAAYVFERNLGGSEVWGEERKLQPSALVSGDLFGDVSISDDRVAVGAGGQDSGSRNSGALFVFGRNEGGLGAWGELERLSPSVPMQDGRFGRPLFQGGLLLAGATGITGSVYVYGPGAPADATPRYDANGANPASYSATPPLIGEDFDATVDLTTTGHQYAFLLGFQGPTESILPGGQVLLVTGGPQLFPRMLVAGPLAQFHFTVPNQPTLCGLSISTQAVHVGTVQPFALSNAVDLVLGTGTLP